jgi:DNA helicase-2/ATP-dependent DNA helicase PcrA
MADRRLFEKSLEAMVGNQEQVNAVNEQNHCVVLAGPGSGKTRTLTTAMARVLLEDVKEPRGIACITYNNECAIELEKRLAQLGVEPNGPVFIGTVHSFALSQIIIPYARCVVPNFPETLGIATAAQRNTAQGRAYAGVIGGGGNPTAIWQKVHRKRKGETDRQQLTWMGDRPELARLAEAYERELTRNGLIDFDGMTLLAARLVREHEWIRSALWSKFPVLFVDEYQDLGTALHDLVLQLCFSAGIRLFAVGDPDQSIYGFTGANPSLLRSLSQRGDLRTITLPFNYRCGTSIIEISNTALGEERTYRAPDGAEAGNVVFDSVPGDLEAQARHITGVLIPALRTNGVNLEDIAVLYRDAPTGDVLVEAADMHGLTYVRADKNALVTRSNRLSRLIEAAASWVTGGWKNADPSFNRLTSEATTFVLGRGASDESRKKIESGLATFLHRTMNTDGSTHEWLQDFKDSLISSWKAQATTVTDEWNVVDRMLAQTDPTEGNQDLSLMHFSGRVEESGRLNLSTFHSSKGREFDVVILFGINHQSLPNRHDLDEPEGLPELRRLFYVAVTRARKELRIVSPEGRVSPWVSALAERIQNE